MSQKVRTPKQRLEAVLELARKQFPKMRPAPQHFVLLELGRNSKNTKLRLGLLLNKELPIADFLQAMAFFRAKAELLAERKPDAIAQHWITKLRKVKLPQPTKMKLRIARWKIDERSEVPHE